MRAVLYSSLSFFFVASFLLLSLFSIFDISPASNMKFESAGFKLTLEMVELMGSDGKTVTPLVEWFQQLVIRGFLAVREHRAEILAIVEPMLASTLVVSICAAHTRTYAPREGERVRLSTKQGD